MNTLVRLRIFALFLFVVLGSFGCPPSPVAAAKSRAEAQIDALIRGEGDWDRFSVTYDDLHPLHGGMQLTIHGDGRVDQKFVRASPNATRTLTRADLQVLAAVIREVKAWEQRTPERKAVPDESKARLILHLEGTETSIWEWYNDLEQERRISRVRSVMTDLAWEKK